MKPYFVVGLALAAVATSRAYAGNEQIYEGPALPVLAAPALTETNIQAEFVPGPAVVPSTSRVARNDTGHEREPVFDGLTASPVSTAYARR